MEMRSLLEAGRYPEALTLLAEMEEMSRDDKINKIEAHLHILLLHLIKQQAEKRTTRSWDLSIRNAARAILRTLKRRKAGGFYLTREEVVDAIVEIFPPALDSAAAEVFEGRYSPRDLRQLINAEQIRSEAIKLAFTPADDFTDEDETDSNLPQWLK